MIMAILIAYAFKKLALVGCHREQVFVNGGQLRVGGEPIIREVLAENGTRASESIEAQSRMVLSATASNGRIPCGED